MAGVTLSSILLRSTLDTDFSHINNHHFEHISQPETQTRLSHSRTDSSLPSKSVAPRWILAGLNMLREQCHARDLRYNNAPSMVESGLSTFQTGANDAVADLTTTLEAAEFSVNSQAMGPVRFEDARGCPYECNIQSVDALSFFYR